MEKIKWIILALLAIVLLLVVFFNKDENLPKLSNFVEFSVKHIDIQDSENIKPLINEGNFVLLLKEIQLVNENAFGLHIEFSLPIDNQEMILVFDIVDTSSTLKSKEFPFSFTNSDYFSEYNVPKINLYRSFIKVGFAEKISSSFKKENTVHLVNIFCKIEKLEILENTINLDLIFTTTHSDLLEDIFKLRYLINGKISISGTQFTERVVNIN